MGHDLAGWRTRWLYKWREVVRRHLPADPLPTTLEIAADDTELRAGEKDTVRVILRALDQGGNVLSFFDDPVEVSLQGPGRIVGPRFSPSRVAPSGSMSKPETKPVT